MFIHLFIIHRVIRAHIPNCSSKDYFIIPAMLDALHLCIYLCYSYIIVMCSTLILLVLLAFFWCVWITVRMLLSVSGDESSVMLMKSFPPPVNERQFPVFDSPVWHDCCPPAYYFSFIIIAILCSASFHNTTYNTMSYAEPSTPINLRIPCMELWLVLTTLCIYCK